MMYLFIDTSYSNIIVGIYENNNKLYERIEKNDNHLSERLLPMIDEAFFSIKKMPSDIDKIIVVNGPGSFTGIRVGVTVAKTMAWGLSKKIKTVSELKLLSTSSTDKKYIAPIIDARRGYAYAGLYDNLGNLIIEDKYVSMNKFIDEIKVYSSLDDVEFVSYDIFENVSVIEPNIDVLKVISDDNSDFISPHLINPNYLKLTEAEEKLQGNND